MIVWLKQCNSMDDFRKTLEEMEKSDNPRERELGMILAKIMPEIMQWHLRLMDDESISANAILVHAMNIAIAIILSIALSTLPSHQVEIAIKDVAQELATILSRIAQNYGEPGPAGNLN